MTLNQRDILNVAHEIAKHPKPLVFEAMKLFMQGEWTDTLQAMEYSYSETMPTGEWLWLDGYWSRVKEATTGTDIFKSEKINKLCPVCGSNYVAYMVTIACPKANPMGWRTRLECSNDECLHEEYSTENKLIIVTQNGVVQ